MAGADEVIRNIDDWQARLRAAAVALAQTKAGDMEGKAKRDAPWTDRTGNARNGIRGQVVMGGDYLVLALAHSVDYGVFLELSDDGKWAILKPTMESEKHAFLRALRQLIGS